MRSNLCQHICTVILQSSFIMFTFLVAAVALGITHLFIVGLLLSFSIFFITLKRREKISLIYAKNCLYNTKFVSVFLVAPE